MKLLFWSLLFASLSLCFAQTCTEHERRFDAFLDRHVGDNKPKASLSIVRTELGQPSSIEPGSGAGFTKAIYEAGDGCRGEVFFDGKGFAWLARVIQVPVNRTPTDARFARVAGIDKQIADLQQQLGALKEMREALVGSSPQVAEPASPVQILPVRTIMTVAPESDATAAPDEIPAAPATPRAPGAYPDREYTTKGQPILTGPRGGRYHISPSGKKVYERRR